MSNEFDGRTYDSKPVSRHSPEGFEEVLKTASEGGVPIHDASDGMVQYNESWFRKRERARAIEAARLIEAWARGEQLEVRRTDPLGLWESYNSEFMPRMSDLFEWRIKRTPRTVWVAFHEGGSVRDIRAMPPAIDIPGQPLVDDYVKFEEALS